LRRAISDAKQSETLLLLPIFLIGLFPMLVFALLGFAGLAS